MARYCESCGSPIDEDASFCEICGAKVEPEEEVVEDAVVPVEVPPTESETIAVPEPAIETPAATMAETPEAAPPVQQPEPIAIPTPEPELEPTPTEETPETAPRIEPASPPVQAEPAYVEPSLSVSPARSSSSLPKAAIAVVAVVVIAGGIVGGMKLLKGKPSDEPVKTEQKPTVQKPTPTPPVQTPAPTKTVDISELRTEAIKVLSDVSAGGWSDAVCKKQLPKLKSLIAKAKEGGREDLSAYWTSLADYVQACNAASKQDRALSKKYLTSAVTELSMIPVEEIGKDSVLKGDVIGSIGSYMSIANDMGLPSSYPSCQILVQLKNKLEKQ